jgi:hypothetical protein
MLELWNEPSSWRFDYRKSADGLLFFAEDVLQDQFCLSLQQIGVFRFHAETGESMLMEPSIEDWARRILENYCGNRLALGERMAETTWPIATRSAVDANNTVFPRR